MRSKYFRGHILRIAVGIVMLTIVLAGTGIALAGHEVLYVPKSPDILQEKGFSGASQSQMPGRLEDSGTHFELDNSNYLNITLDSSEPVDLTIESIPEMATIHIESASGAASAQITLGGFTPHTTYHMYEDNYHNHTAFTTDASGKYTYTQDLSRPHLIFIQPRSSTRFINDNATGGDCTKIGTWDAATKTCTLTGDLNETIQIDSNSTILNGSGHTIAGSYTGNGVYIYGRNEIIIKNLNIEHFITGISLDYSSNNTFSGNNVLNNNYYGISLSSSSNNTLSRNNVSNNYYDGIYLYSSSNNMLSDSDVNSNSGNGIYLYLSSNNTLIGNDASNNYGSGIPLSSSSNNTLSGNSVSKNSYGIVFFHSSNNPLNGNNANSNSIYGIILDSSSNNILSSNNASNNNWAGIYLSSSSNNSIYNNLFNNTENFLIADSPVNTWNTTQTSGTNIIGGSYLGGNFWADPSGTGFSQTCTDGSIEGICDKPYALDGSNIDYLPLTYSNTPPPPPVPEASTAAMVLMGMVMLIGMIRLKKK